MSSFQKRLYSYRENAVHYSCERNAGQKISIRILVELPAVRYSCILCVHFGQAQFSPLQQQQKCVCLITEPLAIRVTSAQKSGAVLTRERERTVL